MQPSQYARYELLPGDKIMLQAAYRKRMRGLRYGYILFIAIALFFPTLGIIFAYATIFFQNLHHNPSGNIAKKTTDIGGFLVFAMFVILVVQLLYLLPAIIVFARKIYPLKKDLRSSEKELVPFTVVKKTYFPLTGQYFIGVDYAPRPDYEVTEEQFFQCMEGDIFFLYRGIHSKFIL